MPKVLQSGPFTVRAISQFGTVELEDKDGETFKVNGHRVKPYFGGETMETNTTLLQEPSQ